jgi:hypothetical protein
VKPIIGTAALPISAAAVLATGCSTGTSATRKVGAWKGPRVGNTWWVVSPNGAKNLTCVPATVPKAVPAPSAGGGGSTY